MPHKTKRQKIASQKRQHHTAGSFSEQSKSAHEEPGVTHFKKDFRKSVAVISLITALEIIVYFGTMYYHSR